METMKYFARLLRKNATDAEQLLWRRLRNRQLAGFKFRRQVAIEPYIVDFVCFDARLIVEADGGQHLEQGNYDSKRTTELRAMGYELVRFWNYEILEDIDVVLEEILKHLNISPHPSPLPEEEEILLLPEGEGGDEGF